MINLQCKRLALSQQRQIISLWTFNPANRYDYTEDASSFDIIIYLRFSFVVETNKLIEIFVAIYPTRIRIFFFFFIEVLSMRFPAQDFDIHSILSQHILSFSSLSLTCKTQFLRPCNIKFFSYSLCIYSARLSALYPNKETNIFAFTIRHILLSATRRKFYGH